MQNTTGPSTDDHDQSGLNSKSTPAEVPAEISAAFTFVPAVGPASLCGEEQQKQARALISRVQAEHVELIECAVREAFAQYMVPMPSLLQQDEKFVTRIYPKWLASKYLGIVASVAARTSHADAGKSDASSERSSGPVQEDDCILGT